LDAMTLERFYEGFFRGHLHEEGPWINM